MISVSQAQALILLHMKIQPIEKVPLLKANQRVLRENIVADRPQPPSDQSAMDGIAINAGIFNQGQRSFVVDAVIPAGMSPKPLKKQNHCVRIMTGALIPKGCTAVVPCERVTISGEHATVNGPEVVHAGQFIRTRGSVASQGDLLIAKGQRLDALRIAVAASVGKKFLQVSSRMKVAFIATGDEMVDVGFTKIKPYQTRMSNAYAVKSTLDASGLADVFVSHVNDKPLTLRQRIKSTLSSFDMVILSGGVSKGDFDHVPAVLQGLGVVPLFHQVSQKPGKPLYVGKTPKGKMVFALPGNPVSTLVCLHRYVVPYLRTCAQLVSGQDMVRLAGQLPSPSPLTQFIPVNIVNRQGEVYAYPVVTGGSGDLVSLMKADGFIEYDNQTKESLRPYFSWRV